MRSICCILFITIIDKSNTTKTKNLSHNDKTSGTTNNITVQGQNGENGGRKDLPVFVGVQLAGVDGHGTVILGVLVAVPIAERGREEQGRDNINISTTGSDSTLPRRLRRRSGSHLSMLSSQVSPTRSSSESACSPEDGAEIIL